MYVAEELWAWGIYWMKYCRWRCKLGQLDLGFNQALMFDASDLALKKCLGNLESNTIQFDYCFLVLRKNQSMASLLWNAFVKKRSASSIYSVAFPILTVSSVVWFAFHLPFSGAGLM